MKVLLINPLTSEKRINVILPNLGLGYLATSLRKEKIEMRWVNKVGYFLYHKWNFLLANNKQGL